MNPSTPESTSPPPQAAPESNDANLSAEPPEHVEVEPLGTSRPALGKKAIAACVEPVRRAAKLMEKGKNAEARPLLESALGECPGYSAALYDLAVISTREGAQAEAADYLGKAIAANFIRYADRASADPELESLRGSQHWSDVEARLSKLRGAWSRSLSEPGAWLIFAHDVPMSMVYAGAPEAQMSWRGQLFYFHLASRRFLPIGRSRQVSGFLIDRDAKRIHLAEIRRIVSLDCVSVDGGWCFQEIRGARISTLDLEKLTLSEPAKLPNRIVSPNSMKIAEGYPWPAITTCEDRLLARYFLPPDPPRDLIVAELTGSETKALGVGTFSDQGCSGPVLPLTPFRLVRTHSTSLKRTCLQLSTEHQLCSVAEEQPGRFDTTSSARKVMLQRGGSEEPLSDGPAVVQIEASHQITTPTPGKVERRGLTCKSLEGPVRVAKIPDSGALAVAASGRYIFVASRWWHITVYDVSDPANPSYVGRIPVPGRAYNVHLSGRYLVVGDGDGVHTFDVSNPLVAPGFPGSPRPAGSVDFRYMGRHGSGNLLAVHGTYAYTIGSKTEDYAGDVHVIDLEDLENPRAVAKIPDTHGAERLRLSGGRLFVSGRTVEAYDLENPVSPKLAGRRGRLPARSFISGSTEIRLGPRRLEIRDVSDPDEPALVGSITLGGRLGDFAVEGRHAYIPGGPQGVHVVQLCDD